MPGDYENIKLDFEKYKKIHLVGIGGAGMSSLAYFLHQSGYEVTGSDVVESNVIKQLIDSGINVYIGHNRLNLPKPPYILVYSSCIKNSNPEIKYTKKLNMPVMHRMQIVAQLTKKKINIAVSGSHGKTTATALIAYLLEKEGLMPGYLIGGSVYDFETSGKATRSKFMVIESDESDSSFLHLTPNYTCLTNIDNDHLEHYKNIKNMIQVFKRFLSNTHPEGGVIFNQDDHFLREKIIPALKIKMFSFGFNKKAMLRASNIRLSKFSSKFDCILNGEKLGSINFPLPGVYNISNAIASIAVVLKLGLNFDSIKLNISGFKGIKRRYQIVKSVDSSIQLNKCGMSNRHRRSITGVTIIEDYAHHPTEINAVISLSQRFKLNRLIGIFQPHRYTRTKYLSKQLAKALFDLDYVILTDIYPAFELPISGVNGKNIYKELKLACHTNTYFLSKDKILPHLLKIIQPKDMILIMGAGDIGALADKLDESIR